jgi:DNA-directed RNA polymerase specialized sigma24 family protein
VPVDAHLQRPQQKQQQAPPPPPQQQQQQEEQKQIKHGMQSDTPDKHAEYLLQHLLAQTYASAGEHMGSTKRKIILDPVLFCMV